MNDLGNPKNKKPKEIPMFHEVCEPCKVYLDNGEDIPLPLLARLLKYKLLDVKQNDIKRTEAEKKVGAFTSLKKRSCIMFKTLNVCIAHIHQDIVNVNTSQAYFWLTISNNLDIEIANPL